MSLPRCQLKRAAACLLLAGTLLAPGLTVAAVEAVEADAAVGADVAGEPDKTVVPDAADTRVYAVAPNDWAAVEVERAYRYGLAPEGIYGAFDKGITRLEFCEVVALLVGKALEEHGVGAAGASGAAGADGAGGGVVDGGDSGVGAAESEGVSVFSDTDSPAVAFAAGLGIVRGVGGGRFDPDAGVTREEVAVMLYRAAGAIGRWQGVSLLPASPYANGAPVYRDAGDIADWACEAVSRLRDGGLMLGEEERQFHPRGAVTREMAFVLAYRMYRLSAGGGAAALFPSGYTGEVSFHAEGAVVTGAARRLVGYVFEECPAQGLDELDAFLNEEPFLFGGAAYRLDREESLNASMLYGPPGSAAAWAGGYYPVYVLKAAAASVDESEADSGNGGGGGESRLYLVRAADADASGVANVYRFFHGPEAGGTEPLRIVTFPNASFPLAATAFADTPDAALERLSGDYALRLSNGAVVSAEPLP